MTKLLLFGPGPSRKDVNFMMNALGMRDAILAISPVVISVSERGEKSSSDKKDIISSLFNFLGIDFVGLALRMREITKRLIRLDADINPRFFILSKEMFADRSLQGALNYRFSSVGQEKIRKCLVCKRGRR